MNTRAAIGIIEFNGQINAICCENDGWVQGVGKLLLTHYIDPITIKTLIDQGHIYRLYETVELTAQNNKKSNRSIPTFVNLNDFESYFKVADYLYLYNGHSWKVKQPLSGHDQYYGLQAKLRELNG